VPELTWVRALDRKHKYEYSEVRVESKELRALLHIQLSHDPGFHFPSGNFDDSITLISPFEPLVHNWVRLAPLALDDEENDAVKNLENRIANINPRTGGVEEDQHTTALIALANDGGATKARKDLATLLEQIKSLTPELKEYFADLSLQEKNKSIEFEYLWTIFPPGELVYSTVFMRKDQVFIVKDSRNEKTKQSDSGKDEKTVWLLTCWTYDWNGRVFNRVPVQFRFEEFEGFRAIDSLPCHPLKFHFNNQTSPDEEKSFRDMLIRRGKRFRELCIKDTGSQMFEYEGDALSHGSGFQRLRNQVIPLKA
jgi:hypothetical protein